MDVAVHQHHQTPKWEVSFFPFITWWIYKKKEKLSISLLGQGDCPAPPGAGSRWQAHRLWFAYVPMSFDDDVVTPVQRILYKTTLLWDCCYASHNTIALKWHGNKILLWTELDYAKLLLIMKLNLNLKAHCIKVPFFNVLLVHDDTSLANRKLLNLTKKEMVRIENARLVNIWHKVDMSCSIQQGIHFWQCGFLKAASLLLFRNSSGRIELAALAHQSRFRILPNSRRTKGKGGHPEFDIKSAASGCKIGNFNVVGDNTHTHTHPAHQKKFKKRNQLTAESRSRSHPALFLCSFDFVDATLFTARRRRQSIEFPTTADKVVPFHTLNKIVYYPPQLTWIQKKKKKLLGAQMNAANRHLHVSQQILWLTGTRQLGRCFEDLDDI